MQDVILGLVAIGAGVLFCFRGHLAFRIVIPVWGGLAIAGMISQVQDTERLRRAVRASWAAERS